MVAELQVRRLSSGVFNGDSTIKIALLYCIIFILLVQINSDTNRVLQSFVKVCSKQLQIIPIVPFSCMFD